MRQRKFLWIFITLLIFCIISAAVLYFTNGWINLVKPVIDAAGYARDARSLDSKYYFKPPADGLVLEKRLGDYLEVCRQAKEPAAKYRVWLESHDIKRAMGHVLISQSGPDLLGGLLSKLLPALEEKKMSLEEFIWINRTIRKAGKPSHELENPEKFQKMIDSLQKLVDDPRTRSAERKRFKEQIETLRPLLAEIKAMPANAALFKRYAESINSLDPGERVMIILEALPQPSRGRVRVRVGNNS